MCLIEAVSVLPNPFISKTKVISYLLINIFMWNMCIGKHVNVYTYVKTRD